MSCGAEIRAEVISNPSIVIPPVPKPTPVCDAPMLTVVLPDGVLPGPIALPLTLEEKSTTPASVTSAKPNAGPLAI